MYINMPNYFNLQHFFRYRDIKYLANSIGKFAGANIL